MENSWKGNEVVEKGRRRCAKLRLQLIVSLQLHQLYLQGDKGIVHGKVKDSGEQLEVRRQNPDSCETGSKFIPQRGDDTDACVHILHVVKDTCSKARKVHKLTISQLSFEGSDECVHVCRENVFILQLHVEGIQMYNDVQDSQGQGSEPSRVREAISVGESSSDSRWMEMVDLAHKAS